MWVARIIAQEQNAVRDCKRASRNSSQRRSLKAQTKLKRSEDVVSHRIAARSDVLDLILSGVADDVPRLFALVAEAGPGAIFSSAAEGELNQRHAARMSATVPGDQEGEAKDSATPDTAAHAVISSEAETAHSDVPAAFDDREALETGPDAPAGPPLAPAKPGTDGLPNLRDFGRPGDVLGPFFDHKRQRRERSAHPREDRNPELRRS